MIFPCFWATIFFIFWNTTGEAVARVDGWIFNFSHRRKEFDRNRKCSERFEMDFHINCIYSDGKCPLFTRLGGGSPKGDNVTFFYRFYIGSSLSPFMSAGFWREKKWESRGFGRKKCQWGFEFHWGLWVVSLSGICWFWLRRWVLKTKIIILAGDLK